ncbi:hypothetical protein ACC862_24325 [Rhizobium ruizarguesonis]
MKPRGILLSVAVVGICSNGWAQTQQETRGDCSPAIVNTFGNNTIICIVTNDDNERKKIALDNISETIFGIDKVIEGLDGVLDGFRGVGNSNELLLLPAMQQYYDEPTTANWATLRDEATLTKEMVAAAIKSALIYSGKLEGSVDPQIIQLVGLGHQRSVMINGILDRKAPISRSEAKEWMRDYRRLVERLRAALEDLRSKIAKS